MFMAFWEVSLAVSVRSTKLPYYIRRSDSKSVYNVYKYYVTSPDNVAFPKVYSNIRSGIGFTEDFTYDENTTLYDGSVKSIFADVSYYGYNLDPSDENYYYTQFYIWKYIFNFDIVMCDSKGNILKEEDNAKIKEIKEAIARHRTEEEFFKNSKKGEIWRDNYFYFSNNEPYELPSIKGLTLEEIEGGFKVSNEEVGNYKVTFSSSNKDEVKWYHTDGDYVFLQNLAGPSDLEKVLNYSVYGTPFLVKEHIVGVNGKYGDALSIPNVYKVYLEWWEKLSVLPNQEVFLRSNSSYTLKDSSSNPAFLPFSDLSFTVNDEENYLLDVTRYVISKKINLNILDDNEYAIYLKSNNELYEVVDKNTPDVILPYGIYLIKSKDNSYQKEVVVERADELTIEINNPPVKEEKGEREEEEEIKDEDVTYPANPSEVIWPPETNDNILKVLLNFIISSEIIYKMKKIINKLKRA